MRAPNDISGSLTKSHLDLISSIYDLPLRPDKWAEVLDRFAPMVGAKLASVAVLDPKYAEHQLNAMNPGFDVLQSEEYRQKFSPKGGYQSAFTNMAQNPKRSLVGDLEMLGLDSIEDYAARPTVQWMIDHCGVFRGTASCLNLERAWTDVLFFMYDKDRGPSTAEELGVATIFLDHFAKTVEVGRSFSVLKSRFHAVMTALDRFHIGVCVLSPNGTLVLKNNEAARIFYDKDGLTLTREGHLSPGDENLREVLRDAIDKATSTAQGQYDQAETLLTVPRQSGSDDYLVEVSPFRETDELDGPFSGCLVYLIDPSKTDLVTTEGMQALYGLTNSESEVCRLVAEGMATEDIADTRNLTRETVRNYIKQVLHKTGTANRSQLVRLALTINLPIDPVS